MDYKGLPSLKPSTLFVFASVFLLSLFAMLSKMPLYVSAQTLGHLDRQFRC